MKIIMRSRWPAIAMLCGAIFIATSVWLTISVNSNQERLRDNVNVIRTLAEMQDLVLQLRDTSAGNATKRQDAIEILRKDGEALQSRQEIGPLVSSAGANVSAIDSIYTVKPVNTGALGAHADSSTADLAKAIKVIRAGQAIISDKLAFSWCVEIVLIIIACVAVVLVVGLLRHTVKSSMRLVEKEKETRRMNIFLDAVLENIPNMVFIKEAKELRFIRFNKAGEELIGHSRQEMIGKNDHDFFPPEQAEFFMNKDREVLQDGRVVDIPEERIETRSSGMRWLHTRKIPFFFENGSPQYILGVSEDITEQKKYIDEIRHFNEMLENKVMQRTAELEAANRQLKQEIADRIVAERAILSGEQRYERLINLIGEGIMYVDNNDTILFVNRKFCEMTGYAESELTGNNAAAFFLEDGDREMMRQRVAGRRDGNANEETYEVQMRKRSGEISRVFVTSVAVRDETGTIIGSMGSHVDVTHLRDTEQKLLRKIRELDMFFYRSSHDLKGPLASMQGLLRLALKDVHDSAAKQYFEMLQRSADKLDKILLGLIEVINITQGKPVAEVVDLEELVNSIVESLSHLPECESVRIVCDIRPGTLVLFDKNQLRSVLQNLIHNAIMYRKKSGADPFVSIRSSKEQGRTRIVVEDNGVGIPEALQERVFDLFFRANENSPGSGLGLYIVRNALEKGGATVQLKSGQGKGSTFTVLIPDASG